MMELIIPILLILAMLYVCYSDATRFIIPNWLVAGLILLYPIWVLTAPAPVDWPMGLAYAGMLLLFGFGVFALGIIGAGDAKLLAALGLYMGLTMNGAAFFINMALIGGAMAIVIVTLRRMLKYQEKKPKLLTPKQPAPYGIAIALAFIWAVLKGHMAGMAAPLF